MKKLSKFGDCSMHVAILTKLIEKHLGLEKDVLISKSRKTEVIEARAMCYFILRTHNQKFSLAEVGFHLGGKDHATVLHGIKAHESFTVSNTNGYVAKFKMIEGYYLSKMAGEGIEDDETVGMILAIEKIEENLSIVKKTLIKNYAESKPMDPVIQEKIESISKLSHDEQSSVLEKDLADGINIPAAE